MQRTDSYFEAVRFFESGVQNTLAWVGCDSTGLAEVIEIAQSKGFTYHLEIEERTINVADYDKVVVEDRVMVFTPPNREIGDFIAWCYANDIAMTSFDSEEECVSRLCNAYAEKRSGRNGKL